MEGQCHFAGARPGKYPVWCQGQTQELLLDAAQTVEVECKEPRRTTTRPFYKSAAMGWPSAIGMGRFN